MQMDENAFSKGIIGADIEVHRGLGPGLLESAYEEGLTYEFRLRSIPLERQKFMSTVYKSVRLDRAFRVDLLVRNSIVVELKAVDRILPIHKAQALACLCRSEHDLYELS